MNNPTSQNSSTGAAYGSTSNKPSSSSGSKGGTFSEPSIFPEDNPAMKNPAAIKTESTIGSKGTNNSDFKATNNNLNSSTGAKGVVFSEPSIFPENITLTPEAISKEEERMMKSCAAKDRSGKERDEVGNISRDSGNQSGSIH